MLWRRLKHAMESFQNVERLLGLTRFGCPRTTGDMEVASTITLTERLLGWIKERKSVHPEDARGIWMDNNNEEYQKYQNIFLGIELFIWGIGHFLHVLGKVSCEVHIMCIRPRYNYCLVYGYPLHQPFRDSA